MTSLRQPCERDSSGRTTLEVHSGLVLGYEAPRSLLTRRTIGDSGPRAALEAVVLRAMQNRPCLVQFSGGRDSSLVLAIAAHVARREGLPPPIALSVRYPSVPETHESDWQDRVVHHLKVPHEIIEVDDGGDELAGELALSRLVRDGAAYPPPVGVNFARIAEVGRGSVVLTGEGGDDVLGPSRVTAFTGHWRRRRRPGRHDAREMARELAPRPLRRRIVQHLVASPDRLAWMRPEARAEVFSALVEDHLDQPWDWAEARLKFLRARMCVLGFESMKRTALREGFEVAHPLVDEHFVTSLGVQFGRWGLVSRSEAMQHLAGDLLPLDVLKRPTKATFNGVYAGDLVREFARQWDGTGVDTAIVDPKELRKAWMSDNAPGPALSPLQLALSTAVERGWAPPPGARPM